MAASLIPNDASRADVLAALGISKNLLVEHADILEARETGCPLTQRLFSKNVRSLTTRHHSIKPCCDETDILPPVLDLTAGGGSIPFEAGRLGLKTIANELEPRRFAFILRATCEWPQRYGCRTSKAVWA